MIVERSSDRAGIPPKRQREGGFAALRCEQGNVVEP